MFYLDPLLGALAQAVAHVKAVGPEAEANLAYAMENGGVELKVIFFGEVLAGEFYAADRVECWDDCNGITTFHRHGWCPVNPEHSDFDCACLGQFDDYEPDYEPDGEAADRAADREYRSYAFTSEEPF